MSKVGLSELLHDHLTTIILHNHYNGSHSSHKNSWMKRTEIFPSLFPHHFPLTGALLMTSCCFIVPFSTSL